MSIREIKENEATFAIEALPEETPIEGNALASGDDEQDRETEQWIARELDRGNLWAWCCVHVEAAWTAPDGEEYTGSAFLGCCSHENEADFARSGYLDDLKREALADLNGQIAAYYARSEALRAALEDRS